MQNFNDVNKRQSTAVRYCATTEYKRVLATAQVRQLGGMGTIPQL